MNNKEEKRKEIEFKLIKISETETDKKKTTTYDLIPVNGMYDGLIKLQIKHEGAEESLIIGQRDIVAKVPRVMNEDGFKILL